MTITVETRGFNEAIFRIDRFQSISRGGLLSAMAETVRRQTIRRFVTKTSPDGAQWAPLKPATMTGWGGRKGSAGDILVDTGRLRGSIASKVSGSTAEIGTNVFYAGFHQGGTSKMVARPFLGMNASDIAELRQVAEAFIGTALR